MLLFIDSANIEEIQHWYDSGLIDGVTTNPSLIAKTGKDFFTTIEQICDIFSAKDRSYISAEVISTEYKDMLAEGKRLHKIAKNVIVKVPLTPDGLRACYALAEDDIDVNVTLCFSLNQAILAAKAKAAFVSPFLGRLDDIGKDGLQLIRDITTTYDRFSKIKTKVLAASVRHAIHFNESAKAGAAAITVPGAILNQLYHHPLTDKGLAKFLEDWRTAKIS